MSDHGTRCSRTTEAEDDAKEDLELKDEDADEVRGGPASKYPRARSARGRRQDRGPPTRARRSRTLRERLERVGYDEAGVDRLVRDDRGLAIRRRARRAPAAARVPTSPSPCSSASSSRGRACRSRSAGGALADVDLRRARRDRPARGSRRRRAGAVRARSRFDGLVVASDHSAARLREDHVLQIGPATRTLAALTVRRPVEAALDLGTGSGVQAFLAARHSERVVGVDLNPRALRVARLNAAAERRRERRLAAGRPVRARPGRAVRARRRESALRRLARARARLPRRRPRRRRALARGGHGSSATPATKAGSRASSAAGSASPAATMETPRRWLEGSGCDVLGARARDRRPGHVRDALEQPPRAAAGGRRNARPSPGWPTTAPAGSRRFRPARSCSGSARGKNWARFDELALGAAR